MLIIGHRGDRQNYDDNTIEGISSAFEKGADGVEFDVYYKPDKGVYLVHPYLHDFNKEYPKLEAVLEQFSKKGRLQIEIKTPEVAAVKAVSNLLKQYDAVDFELTSSVFPLLQYVREIMPEAKIGLIANPLVEDWWTEEFGDYFLMNYLKLTKADGVHIGKPDFWNQERIRKYHEKGFRVCGQLFTDAKEEYEKLVAKGIDSCTADKLDILRCLQ